MTSLLPLLIFVLGSAAPAEARCPGAIEVFHCQFDDSNDRDYDGWPDYWTRRHGPGLPRYVRIRIDPESPPLGGRSLRVTLDGGGGVACSPPIAVGAQSAYVLQGYVRTTNLKNDRVCMSLTFLDHEQRKVQAATSERIVANGGWQEIRLGPVVPDATAEQVLIGLHVEPQGDVEDLHGEALFGSLWLARLPRVALSCNPTPPVGNLLAAGRNLEILCTASGIDAPKARIAFELQDARGRTLARKSRPVAFPSAAKAPEGRIGQAAWKPDLSHPGFYRVLAAVQSDGQDNPGSQIGCTELTLAVIPPQPLPPGSEFGWSLRGRDVGQVAEGPGTGQIGNLPHDTGKMPVAPGQESTPDSVNLEEPSNLAPLTELLGRSGAGWVKYPLACVGGGKLPPLESLIAFHDRLNALDVTLVAMIYSPGGEAATSDSSARSGGVAPHALLASEWLSAGTKLWYPPLEAIQGRLGAQIRWWQLGEDLDPGWAGYANLPAEVTKAKTTLDRIGQGVHVGLGWSGKSPPPAAPKKAARPWEFLAMVSDAGMDEAKLGEMLDAAKAPHVQRWVAIEPMASDAGDVEARAANLTRRIVMAKIHGAEGIFFPDPFDRKRGLVHADGSPTELFVPWRTVALLLGGTQYLGKLEMTECSDAHLFSHGGRLVAVVWNDRAVEETVCLGDEVRQFDLWGGSRECKPLGAARAGQPPAANESCLRARIGRVPTILTGLDERLARWQLSAGLKQTQVASIPGQPQTNTLQFKNTFPQTISGKISVHGPARWRIEPRVVEFRLAPGEAWQCPLKIVLPGDVTTGRNLLGVDFEISADRVYRFSLDRSIEVGMDGLRLDITTRLNPHGDLVIEQTFDNPGKRPVNLRCDLLIPDRRRESAVVALPPGRNQRTFQLAQGKELLGKPLWLRAEEIDGPRVLNYPLVARDASH